MIRRIALCVLVAFGLWALVTRGTRGRRLLSRWGRALRRRSRYLPGALAGARYRLAGRRPDPTVSDDVLADRVRSSLGPLERRRDVPHVHVMAEDHVVLLHGDVPTQADAEAIVREARKVSGVRDVRSRLHIGLVRSDSRPSEGPGGAHPSRAHARLIGAARVAAGLPPGPAAHAVGVVLVAAFRQVPREESAALLAHLPPDVRAVVHDEERAGGSDRPLASRELRVALARASGVFEPGRGERLVSAVLESLREVAPEEVATIADRVAVRASDMWSLSASGSTR